MRQRLQHFNGKAVLILDGCTCHKMERFQTLLESKNIIMMFLVPHSSHLTQPLDLGIFGRLKNIMRDEASYSVNIKEMQTPIDENVRENEPAHVRNKRGKQLVDYIEAILDVFERTTTRRLVVLAFAQAGLLFDFADPHNPDFLKTYVDPAKARALNAYTGMFSGEASHDRTPGFQIWISTLAPNGDRFTPATVAHAEQASEGQAAPSPGEQRFHQLTLTHRDETVPQRPGDVSSETFRSTTDTALPGPAEAPPAPSPTRSHPQPDARTCQSAPSRPPATPSAVSGVRGTPAVRGSGPTSSTLRIRLPPPRRPVPATLRPPAQRPNNSLPPGTASQVPVPRLSPPVGS